MRCVLPRLSLTQEGLVLANRVLAKRARDGSVSIGGREEEILLLLCVFYDRAVSRDVLGYIRRAGEWMKKVRDEDLQWMGIPLHLRPSRAVSHETAPPLARALMLYALTGLNDVADSEAGMQRLAKVQGLLRRGAPPHVLLKKYLAKDDGDEAGDDEENEDGNDGEAVTEDEYGSPASGESSGGGSGGYNPDEPRVPAGQAGGGQWTTGGASAVAPASVSANTGFAGFDDRNSVDNQFAQAFRNALNSPSPKPYDDINDRADASYPLENLIALLGGGEVLAALKGATVATEATMPVVSTAVEDAANAVKEYIGADAKMIVNKDGDLILMNDAQKVRFNINNPHGYKPHFHIEELNSNGDWVDAADQHMYYFKDK